MNNALSVDQFLVSPGRGEASNTHLQVKVRSAQLGGDFSIMQGVMEPGELLCPHTHEREDQCIFIIDGELEFELGGKDGLRFKAGTGSYIIKPRGISHAFWNATETPVKYIELSGQDGFERWVASHDEGNLKAAMNSKRDFAMHLHVERVPSLLKEHGLKKLAGMDEPPAAVRGALRTFITAFGSSLS